MLNLWWRRRESEVVNGFGVQILETAGPIYDVIIEYVGTCPCERREIGRTRCVDLATAKTAYDLTVATCRLVRAEKTLSPLHIFGLDGKEVAEDHPLRKMLEHPPGFISEPKIERS